MNEFDVRLKKTGRSPNGNMLERLRKHELTCTRFIWLYLMHELILMIPCYGAYIGSTLSEVGIHRIGEVSPPPHEWY